MPTKAAIGMYSGKLPILLSSLLVKMVFEQYVRQLHDPIAVCPATLVFEKWLLLQARVSMFHSPASAAARGLLRCGCRMWWTP